VREGAGSWIDPATFAVLGAAGFFTGVGRITHFKSYLELSFKKKKYD